MYPRARKGSRATPSLRDDLAGAAELGRKILELRQAVTHGQHGLGVVDVDAWLEGQIRDGRGVDVDERERRMGGHQVAAALGAIAPQAEVRLLEGREMLAALGDANVLGIPQRECIDGPGGPRAARRAMAVTHGDGCAGGFELDCAAEAASLIS